MSLHDSDQEGIVRIFVALSCELWGYLFNYTSGNRTPGSRFYSVWSYNCRRPTYGMFQLTHMSCDDLAVKYCSSEPWQPNQRQSIITALITLPQGWVLARRRTAITAVWSESLWALCKRCTGNKRRRERSSTGGWRDDKSACISTTKVSFSPIIIQLCHCIIAITTV